MGLSFHKNLDESFSLWDRQFEPVQLARVTTF